MLPAPNVEMTVEKAKETLRLQPDLFSINWVSPKGYVVSVHQDGEVIWIPVGWFE